jgi:hypothetical protein
MSFRVADPAEHRLLYSHLLKRTRYFIANRARSNQPELTNGAEEIGARFAEGAAAGTVMIGDPPRSDAFLALFDWPDAVIRMPFDAPEVAELISTLDGDPGRTARIRRDGIVNGLLRLDWTYRLRAILADAGLSPRPAMVERERRLRSLADQVLVAP